MEVKGSGKRLVHRSLSGRRARLQHPTRQASRERVASLVRITEDIDRAQRLAWHLGVVSGDNLEANRLYARLEAIRGEVDAFRFAGVDNELDVSWIRDQFIEGGLAGIQPRKR